MSSLRDDFDQLFQRLRQGRGLSNTGDDPVYYLVFPPRDIQEVKRQIKEWEAKLKLQGWTMETFSMAEAIHDVFRRNEFRGVWLESEMNKSLDPDSVQAVNETLTDVLVSGDALLTKLKEKLKTLEGRTHTALFITDLEALHPYLRVGSMEMKLQGQFCVPTVFLYPGIREGRTTLRFLGIYPADGNYRSVHFGG